MLYVPRRSTLAFPAGRAPGFNPNHIAAGEFANFSAIPFGEAFVNILSGKVGTYGTVTPQLLPFGPAVHYANNAGPPIALFNGAWPTRGFSTATLAFIGVLDTYVNKFWNTVYLQTASVTTFNQCGWALENVFNPMMVISRRDGANLNFPNTFLPPAGVPIFIAGSISGALKSGAMVIKRLDTGAVISTTATTGTNLGTVGSDGNVVLQGSLQSSMAMHAAMASDNFLSEIQLLQWANDPWSFWYPAPRRKFVGRSSIALYARGYAFAFARGNVSPQASAYARSTAAAQMRGTVAPKANVSASSHVAARSKAAPAPKASLAARGMTAARTKTAAGFHAALSARSTVAVRGRATVSAVAHVAAASFVAARGAATFIGILPLTAAGYVAGFMRGAFNISQHVVQFLFIDVHGSMPPSEFGDPMTSDVPQSSSPAIELIDIDVPQYTHLSINGVSED